MKLTGGQFNPRSSNFSDDPGRERWWVPSKMWGIHQFIDRDATLIGKKYHRPSKVEVLEMGTIDKKTKVWMGADEEGNTVVEPGVLAMYRVKVYWGKQKEEVALGGLGSISMSFEDDDSSKQFLMLATDGRYMLPLVNDDNDTWRWESTLLGVDAGDMIIAAIMEVVNAEEEKPKDEDDE